MGPEAVPEGPAALSSAQSRVVQARSEVAERLAADGALASAYADLLARTRDLCLFDPRRGEPNPKDLARAARGASYEARRALALRGPGDGVARGVMKHLSLLELNPEDRFLGALACALEDPEHALAHLPEARLAEGESLSVALLALKLQPVLDFEEYKSIETLYLSVDPGGGAADTRRRYEQARSRRAQHVRKHLVSMVPEALNGRPATRFAVLEASLARDPFGTLDHFREAPVADPCAGLSPEQRLDLLDRVASFGLGLASAYLDLFAIPPDPAWVPRLQKIFRADLTAGSSIFGVHALEGVQHYPFGLERIEPVLPRRITNADAVAYLKRGEPESAKPREFTSGEVSEALGRLQEMEVRRFMEVLKADVGRRWKSCVQERKRDILFADPELKIRNVLFLIAQGLFEPEETFEAVYRTTQKCHPLFASQAPRMLLLANRYYFLDVLGLNPGLLFNRAPRPGGGARTLLEEAGDYPVRTLLHVGMSIHLRVGDALFRAAPIAWNILVGQFEGRIDPALQEIAFLFDVFDTLLTIASPLVPDLGSWVGPLVDALVADASDLPFEGTGAPPQAPLRLTTRTTLERYRERLGQYCVQALQRSAREAGVTPVKVIQGLRLPRNKTDKLRTLLDQDRSRS